MKTPTEWQCYLQHKRSPESCVVPGLTRNRRETRTRDDMKELRTTLDRLAPIIELTIMRALSNHVSLCGLVTYPRTKDNSPARAPINNAYC
jgi:hypothetical protein